MEPGREQVVIQGIEQRPATVEDLLRGCTAVRLGHDGAHGVAGPGTAIAVQSCTSHGRQLGFTANKPAKHAKQQQQQVQQRCAGLSPRSARSRLTIDERGGVKGGGDEELTSLVRV